MVIFVAVAFDLFEHGLALGTCADDLLPHEIMGGDGNKPEIDFPQYIWAVDPCFAHHTTLFYTPHCQFSIGKS